MSILRDNRYIQNIWVSMALSAVLPIILGFSMANHFPEWRWTHYPFHSMVESVGAISAITIASLMIMMINKNHLPRYYIWAAIALIGMGILDGFHSILHAGTAFVWLHSTATLIGGVAFACIWLPARWLTPARERYLLPVIVMIAITLGLLSIALPQQLPVMVINGEFSLLAKFLNIAGGMGFLVGTAYFVHLYYLHKKNISRRNKVTSDMVFANHCLLFGIAGLLFESSMIWDAGWWWWHILRLAAYLIVLVYYFSLFAQQQDILRRNEITLLNTNKDLENRVKQRTLQLEKANNAKTKFLSSMSHELRTPMNAILGFSQLLNLDEDLNKDQKEQVTEILNAGTMLLHLIDEVLDVSRIEQGKIAVKFDNVNVSKLVKESCKLLEIQADKYGVSIVCDNSPEDIYINTDELRFKQVLVNLVSNGLKYNKPGGKVIINIEPANTTTRILIRDTGIGIAPEKMDALFQPFERLGHEGSTTEGVGIGLFHSKKLVEILGGKLSATSTYGEGSTFTLEFAAYPS